MDIIESKGLFASLFTNEFGGAMIRFLLCMFINWLIVEFFYFRKGKRRDFYFTVMLISVAIFFLVYFMMGMERGKATMGVGLGLFGIFSIMRYRTDAMPVREMTYLFMVICLSVVHAMDSNYVELAIIDAIVIVAIVMFERTLKVQPSKLVQYDRIELVKPERYQELMADLEERLGLKILKVEVGAVDFLRDMAMLRVYYKADGVADKELNDKIKLKNTDYAHI